MRLLSVDWDYFVPSIDHEVVRSPRGSIPYALDIGEYFTPDMLDALWDSRAAALLARGVPLPGTSGEEQTFWERFHVSPGAVLYYADSHAQAAHPRVRTAIAEVWNYDAHHDCGYEGAADDFEMLGWVGCANWMCYYALRGATLQVRYPFWRGDAAARERPPLCSVNRSSDSPACSFDVIFVARSSAWTPPWLDGDFEAFLEAAPVSERHCLDPFWHRRRLDMSWVAHLRMLTPVP